jgi:hypothetical protein
LSGQVTKWDINGTPEQVIISNLSFPYLLAVDQNQFVYIADSADYQVIKVDNQTKNVTAVAGESPGANLS